MPLSPYADHSIGTFETPRKVVMPTENAIQTDFDSRDRAEGAIRRLQKSVFDMEQFSTVGKGCPAKSTRCAAATREGPDAA